MRNNKVTLIVMGLALVVFFFVKVAPMFRSAPSHETKHITVNKKKEASIEPKFVKEGEAWFLSPTGDTVTQLNIELATTGFEQAKGMMDRKFMKDNHGMLFVFQDMSQRAFWMKNTFISLDIIYIKEDGTIDSFYKNAVPFSEKSLPSTGDAMYVLEVNGGYLDKNEITLNYKLTFEKL